jgi:UDP-2,3-diacylglucosamine pyrophosphatase LpxH
MGVTSMEALTQQVTSMEASTTEQVKTTEIFILGHTHKNTYINNHLHGEAQITRITYIPKKY